MSIYGVSTTALLTLRRVISSKPILTILNTSFSCTKSLKCIVSFVILIYNALKYSHFTTHCKFLVNRAQVQWKVYARFNHPYECATHTSYCLHTHFPCIANCLCKSGFFCMYIDHTWSIKTTFFLILTLNDQ